MLNVKTNRSIIGGVIYNSAISILQYAVILIMWTILVLTLKWLNNNVHFVKRLIDGKPTLLIKNGKIDPEACRSVGLSAADVALKLRSQGIFQMKQVKRAMQEQNGQLIVVQMGDENPKYPVVTDGVIQVEILETIGRSEEWMLDNLRLASYIRALRPRALRLPPWKSRRAGLSALPPGRVRGVLEVILCGIS